MKISFSIILIAALAIYGCSTENKSMDKTAYSNDGSDKKPNIIFIMSDDHALQAISAYGSDISKIAPTPNIDRIANGGALFKNAFNTNSICGPCRASILTGKYSHINGFFKNVDGGDFDGSQWTFPKEFQKAGYETSVIGKWHLGTTPTGFDYSKVLVNYGGQGTYFDGVFVENGKDTTVAKKHSTTAIADDAISWLKKRKDDKPFMMLYQFKAPHRPWRPDPELADLYEDIEFPLPETFNDDYEDRKAASENLMSMANLNRRDMKMTPPEGLKGQALRDWENMGNKEGEFWTPHDSLQGQELREWKYQKYIKDYLRCVAGVDRSVGRMLDYLEEAGLDENTIIIYTSDQGFYLGEHGWYDKRWMYEESFKTPFMIKYPGVIEPGTVIDEMVVNIDFAPTLLDFAGINSPEKVQGESFVPLLTSNEKKVENQWRDAVYYHYYEWPIWHRVQPHYGVRDDRYKLIRFYYSMDEWELYDLKEDPNEVNNLYGEPGYEEITARLKKKMEELQEKYDDDMSEEEMKEMTDVKIKRVYNEPN